MAKHYNTQNDSASLSAFFFYGISPIQRPHYITSSYTYQFYEKSYFCSSLQYRSALVVARMVTIYISIHSLNRLYLKAIQEMLKIKNDWI